MQSGGLPTGLVCESKNNDNRVMLNIQMSGLVIQNKDWSVKDRTMTIVRNHFCSKDRKQRINEIMTVEMVKQGFKKRIIHVIVLIHVSGKWCLTRQQSRVRILRAHNRGKHDSWHVAQSVT